MFKQGEVLLLYVTHVESGCRSGQCEIWAQTDTLEYSKLERLIATTTATAPNTCLSIDQIEICDILLARYSLDNQWYRVQVTEKCSNVTGSSAIGPNNVKVIFVDFGNTDVVSVTSLAVPEPIVFVCSPLAERFILEDIGAAGKTHWTTNELQFLNQQLVNNEYSGEITDCGTVGYPPTVRMANLPVGLPLRSIVPIHNNYARTLYTLVVGKCYEVFVTHADSQLSFSVQLVSLDEDLQRFYQEINRACDRISDAFRPEQVSVGLVCLALHKGTRLMRRAVVGEIRHHSSVSRCHVTYIDYGDSDVVTIDQLLRLREEFGRQPAHIIKCCLTGNSGQLGPKVFRRMLLAPDRKYIQVRSILPSCRHLVELSLDPSAFGVNMQATTIAAPKLSQLSPLMTAAARQTSAPAPRPAAVPDVLPAPLYSRIDLVVNSTHDVCICHVDPMDGTFYFQLIVEAPRLDALMSRINVPAGLRPFRDAAPVAGSPCLVKNKSDGVVYRGRIQQAQTRAPCVELVDFGNVIETNPSTDLFSISDPEIIGLPIQAIRGRLANVSKCPPAVIASVLRLYESSVALVAKVTSVSASPCITVELFFTGSNDLDLRLSELVRSCAGNPSVTPPPPKFSMNQPESVTGCIVLNDGRFFAQLNCYSMEELESFQVRLNEFYSNVKLPDPTPTRFEGQFCVCRYEQDDQFYRARIIKKTGASQFLVDFIDYGGQQIEGFASLKVLVHEFTWLPCQGIKCSLVSDYAVPAPSSPDTARFKQCITEKQLIVEATSKSGEDDDYYFVRLPRDRDENRELLRLIEPTSSNLTVGSAMQSSRFDAHRRASGEPQMSSTQYRTLTLDAGKWQDVLVTHINDPENFYCQLIPHGKKDEVLNKVMSEIQMYVGRLPPGFSQPRSLTLGMPVFAIPVNPSATNTSLWYRASVTGIRASKPTTEVQFIDYGQSDFVNTADLLEAPSQFLEVPMQAFPCSLLGIAQSAKEGFFWSREQIERFQEMCDDKAFTMCWMGERDRNGHHLIHLLDGQENINRSFLRGFKQLRPDYSTPVGVRNLPSPRNDEKASEYFSSFPVGRDLSMDERSSRAGARLGGYRESGGNNQRGEPGDRSQGVRQGGSAGGMVGAGSDGFGTRSPVDRQDGNTEFIGAKSSVDRPGNAGSYRAGSSAAAGADEFSAKSAADRQENSRGFGGARSSAGRQENTGGFSGAKSDMQNSRSSVNSKGSTGKFGSTSDSRNDRIVNGPTSNFTNRSVSDSARSMTRIENTGTITPSSKNEYDYLQFQVGETVKCVIAFAYSPSKFYVQPIDTSELDRLMVRLNTVCNKDTTNEWALSRDNIKNGIACCAKYSEDQRWYRAKVLACSPTDNSINVLFVDYGNEESVPLAKVRRLTPEHLTLPVQCVTCSLHGLKPTGGAVNWSDEACTLFEDMTQTVEYLSAKVVRRDTNGSAYHVELIGYPDNTSLSSALISAGHAARTGDTAHTTANIQHQATPAAAPSRPVTLPVYIKETVKLGSKELVVASWIDSPTDFYVQFKKNEAVLNRLSKDLNVAYNKLRTSEQILPPCSSGRPCIALYEEDGRWYRGVVIDVKDAVASIRYVDFGNVDTVPLANVKEISTEFMHTPIQALRCSLRGLAPNTKIMPDVASAFDAALAEDVSCTFVELQEDDRYVVDLFKESGENLNQMVLASGCTKQPAGDDAPRTVSGRIGGAVIAGNAPQASSMKMDDVSKSVSCKYKPLELQFSIGQVLAVDVQWVDGSGIFYVHDVDQMTATLDKLMEELAAYYSELGLIEMGFQTPTVGCPCAAKYSEDGGWYRAIIEKIEAHGAALVRFVDYGNGEICQPYAMKVLLNRFLDVPIQCLTCVLDGFKVDDTGAADKLSDLILNKRLKARVVGRVVDTLHVSLVDESGADLLPQLQPTSTAATNQPAPVSISSSDNSIADLAKTLPPLVAPVTGDATVNVYVSHVISPAELYVQLEASSDELAELADTLVTEYDSAALSESLALRDVRIGLVCCARYSLDAAWYRAIVREITEDCATVLFVDYGNTDDVPCSELKYLTASHTSGAPLAYPCSLVDLAVPVGGWKDEHQQTVVTLTEGGEKAFRCKFVSEVPPFKIALFDEAGRNIADGLKFFAGSARPVLESDSHLPSVVAQSSDRVTAYIMEVTSPNLFYLQLTSRMDELYSFGEALLASIETAEPLERAEVGVMCIAMYSEDSAWYRSKIVSVDHDAGLATVLFVDYGNCDTVPIDTLKKLSAELAEPKNFAVRCRLSGLSTTASWNDEDILAASKVITETVGENQISVSFTGDPDLICEDPCPAIIYTGSGERIIDILMSKIPRISGMLEEVEESQSAAEDISSSCLVGDINVAAESVRATPVKYERCNMFASLHVNADVCPNRFDHGDGEDIDEVADLPPADHPDAFNNEDQPSAYPKPDLESTPHDDNNDVSPFPDQSLPNNIAKDDEDEVSTYPAGSHPDCVILSPTEEEISAGQTIVEDTYGHTGSCARQTCNNKPIESDDQVLTVASAELGECSAADIISNDLEKYVKEIIASSLVIASQNDDINNEYKIRRSVEQTAEQLNEILLLSKSVDSTEEFKLVLIPSEEFTTSDDIVTSTGAMIGNVETSNVAEILGALENSAACKTSEEPFASVISEEPVMAAISEEPFMSVISEELLASAVLEGTCSSAIAKEPFASAPPYMVIMEATAALNETVEDDDADKVCGASGDSSSAKKKKKKKNKKGGNKSIDNGNMLGEANEKMESSSNKDCGAVGVISDATDTVEKCSNVVKLEEDVCEIVTTITEGPQVGDNVTLIIATERITDAASYPVSLNEDDVKLISLHAHLDAYDDATIGRIENNRGKYCEEVDLKFDALKERQKPSEDKQDIDTKDKKEISRDVDSVVSDDIVVSNSTSFAVNPVSCYDDDSKLIALHANLDAYDESMAVISESFEMIQSCQTVADDVLDTGCTIEVERLQCSEGAFIPDSCSEVCNNTEKCSEEACCEVASNELPSVEHVDPSVACSSLPEQSVVTSSVSALRDSGAGAEPEKISFMPDDQAAYPSNANDTTSEFVHVQGSIDTLSAKKKKKKKKNGGNKSMEVEKMEEETEDGVK